MVHTGADLTVGRRSIQQRCIPFLTNSLISSIHSAMAFLRFIHPRPGHERLWPLFFVVLVIALFGIQLHLSSVSRTTDAHSAGCRTDEKASAHIAQGIGSDVAPTKPLPYPVFLALVHYATTNVTPQQTNAEVMVTANILSRRAPCNLLVFGLGYDSLLWHTLNHGGNTVFLEEDPSWIEEMARASPNLKSIVVNYTTTLSQAEVLLDYARRERNECSAGMDLRESRCRLAMRSLPDEIYETKWDVIMIDAPRGYFAEAPGRMSVIFSVALMAKARQTMESTDIVLHDVDRDVEKAYSTEFLCRRNLVQGVGKLWHFRIHGHGSSGTTTTTTTTLFCSPSDTGNPSVFSP